MLDGPQEVRHLHVQDLEPTGFLHHLDPLQGLALGVDHQWPAVTARDQHPVLRAEVIARQTLDLPVADLCGLGQEVDHAERSGHRDRQLPNLRRPGGVDQVIAVLRVEGPSVRQKGRGQQGVTHQVVDAELVTLDGLRPALALATQPADNLLGTLQLALGLLGIVLELLLLRELLVGLSLQLLHLLGHLPELVLGVCKHPLLPRQLLSAALELQLLRHHLLLHQPVAVNCNNPLAQPLRGSTDPPHDLGLEPGVRDVLRNLRQQGVRELRHLVVLEVGQEVLVRHRLFGLIPSGGPLQHGLHRAHHGLHLLWGCLVGLHLIQVRLLEGFQGLVGGLQLGHGLVELLLGFVGDGVGNLLLSRDLHLVRFDLGALLVGHALLLSDDAQQAIAVHLSLGQRLALHLQVHSHALHGVLGVLQLGQPALQLVALVAQLRAFAQQQLGVPRDQLQVVRRGDVVRAPQLQQHPHTRRGHAGMHQHEHVRNQSGLVLPTKVHPIQEPHRHLLQRFPRPLGEPVDAGVVDQRGEHSQPEPELVPHGGHAHHHMQVGAGPVNEELVHVLQSVVDVRRDGLLPKLLPDHRHLIRCKQVRNLSTAQDGVQVLQEGRLHDLRV
eukprot:RCo053674